MITPRCILASTILVASLGFAPSAFAQDLDQLFAEGTAALEAGKNEEALRAFEAVWKVRKTHDVAANLAQAEVQIGKHRDAAEHLTYALRTFPVSGKPSLRKQIEALLAETKTRVVTLRVDVSVEKADVTVNGKLAGTAPLADELFADAGSVSVEATLDGYESAKQTFEGKKGEARDVVLTLVPKQVPGRSIVPPAIAFGVGGAGLVLGVVTGAVAITGKNDLSKTCDGSGTCPASARGTLDTTIAMSHVSTVGLIAAGLGAAAGVTLLLLPAKAGSDPKAAVGVGPGFVTLKGSF